MSNKVKRPLRTTLTLWFLAFSIIPQAFISGYSTALYESSLNRELQKRLEQNLRDVGGTIADVEAYLLRNGRVHATDPALVYHVATRNIPSIRRSVNDWLRTYSASRIMAFDRDGRLIVAQKNLGDGKSEPLINLESGEIYLADDLIKSIVQNGQVTIREVRKGQGLSLVVYTRVVQKGGATAGFLEESKELDSSFLNGIKSKLNLEAVIFTDKKEPAASSQPDFLLYPGDYFPAQISDEFSGFFDLAAGKEPFGMMVRKIVDAQGKPLAILGLAASKSESQKVLLNIKIALFTVVIVLFLLLIPALSYITYRILNPVQQLVEATLNPDLTNQIHDNSQSEVGLLVESFNDMSKKVRAARADLEKKIKELKDTQASLVQSAKMASLGALVAGVAHELNNPIGYIYSNMAHLKDYIDKLNRVLEAAEKNPSRLDAVKKEVDFDFIIDDLPKLIASCEEGARRTREIVVGLRNFSRLDEASLKHVDIHEGIRNTVKLLSGELKNRIKVIEKFGDIPQVKCYVSQLNQVFMNIISNSAQAIEGQGQIEIQTWKEGDNVFVQFKDSGPGIPEKHLAQIFDPFFTTKPVGQGTGLGLSITYGIIEKHGGHIEVFNDKGAVFKMSLPIEGPKETKKA